jgi:hypothetical protein
MIDYSTISVGSIDDIKNAYKEAESKISDNYDSWKSNTNEVTKVIGNDYDDTKDKINDVTSASTSLSNYI